MRKIISITLALVMILAMSTTAFAQVGGTITKSGPTEELIKVEKTNNIVFSGVVTEIQQVGDTQTITLSSPADVLLKFIVSPERTINYNDKTGVNRGDNVWAVYGKDSPMMMSYPGIVKADLIVVGYEGTVTATILDENSLAEDGSIYIRTSQDTEIVDLAGNTMPGEKVVGKNILAFYQIVLTSYPGQTVAEKIIVTDTDRVPLRAEAEKLGFKVTWVPETKSVIINRPETSLTVILYVGDVNYGYNKARFMFSKAPELINGITYVDTSLIDLLAKINTLK